MAKRKFFAAMNDWLSDEEGALERTMEAAQEQEAAPDIEKLTPAEIRWAKEELEEERRIEASLRDWTEKKGKPAAQALYNVLCVGICLTLIALLLYTVTVLPQFGAPDHPINNEVSARYIEKGLQETGAVNIVTGMILDYRAFDTLGESHVLFTGICAVMILLLTARKDSKKQLRHQDEEALYDVTCDPIVRIMAFFLMPCLLLFGIYVLLNGHLSPGGGFSGGAILGAAFILYSMAFGFEKTERFLNEKTIKVISCCSLGFYVVAKSYSFFTGANHLPSIISPGTPGAILSAGIIMPLNVAVGMVVACTMYSIFSFFKRGTV